MPGIKRKLNWDHYYLDTLAVSNPSKNKRNDYCIHNQDCSSSSSVDEMPELNKCQRNDEICSDVSGKQLLNDLDMDNRNAEIINDEVIKCNGDSGNESSIAKSKYNSDTEQVSKNTSNNLVVENIDDKLHVSSEFEMKEALKIDTSNFKISTSGLFSKNLSEIKTELDSFGQNGVFSTLLHKDENKNKDNMDLVKDNMKIEIKEEKSPDSIGFVGKLAFEISEMIFLMLEPEDLASCSMVCKSWRDVINSDVIWRQLCKQRGWTKILSDWCCFLKSSHIWLEVVLENDTYRDKLSPLCKQRQCFNKYMFLLKYWKQRKFSIFHLSKLFKLQNYGSILSCNSKYLVMPEHGQLLVWDLEGVPRQIDCRLCFQMKVDNICVGYDMIAVAQGPHISVYSNKATRFELAYIKSEFVETDEIFSQRRSFKTSRLILELDNDYLIACADYIDSPTYVWDRKSGISLLTIRFETVNSSLSEMNLYGSSLFFVLKATENVENVVEFNLDLKCWTNFNVSISHRFRQLLVNNDFFCLVTESEIRGYKHNICIWKRDTGEIVKSLKVCGKSYLLVNNYLVYYHNARVIVQPVEEDYHLREIYLDDNIMNLRPVFDNLFVISTREKVEVWDWVLKKKLYTAFYSHNSNFDMWVDCEKIVLQSSNQTEFIILRF